MSSHPLIGEEIEDTAANWLWRRVSADWSDVAQAELDLWLDQSERHAAAFWRLEAVWERTGRVTALRPMHTRENAPAFPYRRWFGIGAAAAIVFGIIAFTMLRPGSQAGHAQNFSTAVGGRATIRLADGSRIELNTDTAITANITAKSRTLELKKGEALFNVKHDAARPFVVQVAGHRIVDLGTTFSVRADKGSLKVTLVEGRARLESDSATVQPHSTELTPGEVVVATATSMSISRMESRELNDSLAWKRGQLVFRHLALADAAKELNRYNRTKLVIGDDIAALKINGTFEADSVEAFARMAQYAMRLRVEKSGNEIRLER
jgi:transmembrane sensor